MKQVKLYQTQTQICHGWILYKMVIIMGKLVDLIGQKFGKLTVFERADDCIHPSGKHSTRWLCKCDCGNEIIVIGQHLKKGLTKSCGCLQKRYNTFDLSNGYGIGYTSKGEEFWFDIEDYSKIKDYCWYVSSNGYLATGSGKNTKLIHRLITDCESNMVVDHINHDKMNNRKYNLRICKQSENSANCKVSVNNSSGVTGVFWDNTVNKWGSHITVNRKSTNLGKFDSFEDAVKARKNAEEKYFGEFSYDNSQSYLDNL